MEYFQRGTYLRDFSVCEDSIHPYLHGTDEAKSAETVWLSIYIPVHYPVILYQYIIDVVHQNELWVRGYYMGWSQIIYWICLGINYELILMSLDTFLSQNKTNQQKRTQHRCWVDVLWDEFALLLLLGRAPQLRVD